MAGRFITFEGGEGAGKSTQVRLLADHLRRAGRTVVITREPGGSPFAERIRDVLFERGQPQGSPLAEALLFSAARADHLTRLIRPALARGDWVISDRFMDSTRAYQGAGGAVAATDIDALEAVVVGPTRPDLTLILDLEPRVGLERARLRQATLQPQLTDRDPFEARELAFHERLRHGFLGIAAREPQRCAVIDGSLPVEAIATAVGAVLAGRFGVA
ncbi:MAG: dTMP kinase [Hyphomicrobiaceae bacterium]